MPLAKRTDVIDQALDMALHPASDCLVSIASASMILCLSQSPEAHSYIVRKEVIEKMLEMCEQKHKIINEQSSQSHQGKKENPMAVIALKYVTNPLLFLSWVHTHTQWHAHTHTHTHYLYSGATLVLCWLRLDLVHHISCLSPFHHTLCNKYLT